MPLHSVYATAALIAVGLLLAFAVTVRFLGSRVAGGASGTHKPRRTRKPGGGSAATPSSGRREGGAQERRARPDRRRTRAHNVDDIGVGKGGRRKNDRPVKVRGSDIGAGEVRAGYATPVTRPRPAGRRAQREPLFDDYGLLRTVALVESMDTGRSLAALLATGNVRATVAVGPEGLVRVLVFPDAYDRARRMVSWVL